MRSIRKGLGRNILSRMFETGAAGRRARKVFEICKEGTVFSKSITDKEAKKQYDYNDDDEFGGSCFAPQSISADCDEYMKLIGCEFDFHGAQGSLVRLNDIVYEFLEDPDDGYRSHLGAVRITPASEHTGFFPNPIAKVILISTDHKESWPDEWTPPPKDEWHDGPFSGFFFIDADDYHIWCQIGTEYGDSYYPCMVTHYSPKEPS